MGELQLELQDVIAGFETRLRRIKRNGFKAFDLLPDDTMSEEEAEYDVETPPFPEVSILPIVGDEPDPATPILENEFPVVGRGKAEVEEAFARADAALNQEHSEVFEHTPDDGISEAESSMVAPPSMTQIHEEL
jgi:hypothetical protein